jgi:hypothetical protein
LLLKYRKEDLLFYFGISQTFDIAYVKKVTKSATKYKGIVGKYNL